MLGFDTGGVGSAVEVVDAVVFVGTLGGTVPVVVVAVVVAR